MRERDAYMRTVIETVSALKKSLKESDLKKEQLQKDVQDMKKNVEDCARRVCDKICILFMIFQFLEFL